MSPLYPGDPGSGHAGHEGTVGMDDPETPSEDLPEEDRVHFRDAGHIGRPEGDLDGEIVQHLVFLGDFLPSDIA